MDVAEHEGQRRARALERLHLLGDLPPESLQRVVRLAAHLAGGVDVSAAVHLLDEQHQHRVAAVRAPLQRSALDDSICRLVVEQDRSVDLPDPRVEDQLEGSPWTSGPDRLQMYHALPIRMPDSGPVGSLCVFSREPTELDSVQRARLADLADLAASQLQLLSLSRELGHDAAHDALTGLPNRVLLSARLSAVLARRARPHHEPALLLIDLDGFKQVNDAHGHGVGDQVLVSTARRLRSAVRPEDLVSRLGGDEFAVLVETADVDGVRGLVARLQAVAERPHDTTAGPVRCGFSVGAAQAEAGDLSYELLGRADVELYAAKARRTAARPARG